MDRTHVGQPDGGHGQALRHVEGSVAQHGRHGREERRVPGTVERPHLVARPRRERHQGCGRAVADDYPLAARPERDHLHAESLFGGRLDPPAPQRGWCRPLCGIRCQQRRIQIAFVVPGARSDLAVFDGSRQESWGAPHLRCCARRGRRPRVGRGRGGLSVAVPEDERRDQRDAANSPPSLMRSGGPGCRHDCTSAAHPFQTARAAPSDNQSRRLFLRPARRPPRPTPGSRGRGAGPRLDRDRPRRARSRSWVRAGDRDDRRTAAGVRRLPRVVG